MGSEVSKKVPTPEQVAKAGEGIRSIKTTNVFQMVNFELYVKPNLVVMSVGLVCLGLSSAYLAYLKASMTDKKTYIAIAEDGSQTLRPKSTKWE